MENTARQPKRDEVDIPALIKTAVHAIAPDAEVYLYGSRARGDFEPDSDWDILVLCGDGEDRNVKDRIREAVHALVFEVGSESGDWPSISTMVHSRAYWGKPLIQATPYHREVTKDGIEL